MLGRFLVLSGSLALVLAAAACGGSVSGGGSGGSAGSGGSGGAGGSGGSGGAGGAGFQLTCFNQGVTYPPASKACVTDADCGQILHVVDCCGSLAAIGLDADDLAAVSMAEQQCGMQAICDCVAKPTTTEDGQTVQDPMMVGVGCVMGACMTKALP